HVVQLWLRRAVAVRHLEVAVQRGVARERGVALAVGHGAGTERQRGDHHERRAQTTDILGHAGPRLWGCGSEYVERESRGSSTIQRLGTESSRGKPLV